MKGTIDGGGGRGTNGEARALNGAHLKVSWPGSKSLHETAKGSSLHALVYSTKEVESRRKAQAQAHAGPKKKSKTKARPVGGKGDNESRVAGQRGGSRRDGEAKAKARAEMGLVRDGHSAQRT